MNGWRSDQATVGRPDLLKNSGCIYTIHAVQQIAFGILDVNILDFSFSFPSTHSNPFTLIHNDCSIALSTPTVKFATWISGPLNTLLDCTLVVPVLLPTDYAHAHTHTHTHTQCLKICSYGTARYDKCICAVHGLRAFLCSETSTNWFSFCSYWLFSSMQAWFENSSHNKTCVVATVAMAPV